jgi:hypothetical protein
MTESRLFSPIVMRGLTRDHRIVLSPMCYAHPRIGQAMDFSESPEKRRRMLEVMREEERVSQAR